MIPRILIVVTFLMVFAVGVFDHRGACANISGACNPQFETAMHAQATMQAMREVEIAAKLILKPDSVLEMSCFHLRVDEAGGEGGGNVFTDATSTSNPHATLMFQDPVLTYTPGGPFPGFLPTMDTSTVTAPNRLGGAGLQFGPNPPGGSLHTHHMNNALGLLVSFSLEQFLFENFGHGYGGGTFASAAASGTCNPMHLVWEFIKCTDFDASTFMTFRQLMFIDPRVVPSYVALSCNDPNRSTNWNTAITAATINVDSTTYTLPSPSGNVQPTTIQPGPEDVDTFADEITPASGCGASVQMIETGVRVYQGSPPAEVHDDAVCVVAGCHYNGSACVE